MIAPLLATLALAAPAADLNALFAGDLPQVRAKTRLAILLPDEMPTTTEKLYASAYGKRDSYAFDLAGSPDCGGATACFEAEFSAVKGGRPFGRGKATLSPGRHGRYQPRSCGASCSPPQISWRERGATHRIQADVEDETHSARRILVKMANEAIKR